MLAIDPGSGTRTPAEPARITPVVVPPPSNATHPATNAPPANYILNYTQYRSIATGKQGEPSQGIKAALGDPVEGANYRGISLSTKTGREYGSGETTRTNSTQVNYSSAGGKGSSKTEQSLTAATNGSTATTTRTLYQQNANGTYEGQTKLQISTQPSENKLTADEAVTRKSGLSKAYSAASLEYGLTGDTPSGSLASKTFSAKAGPLSASATVSALGYDTSASASVSLKGNTLIAQAGGTADAYLGKVDASVSAHLAPGVDVNANGTAQVGAGVDGKVQAVFDPSKGTVKAGGDLGAFVGAKAEGDVGASLGAVGTDAKGQVGAGLGANVDANVGLNKGKLSLDFGFDAYLGVGGGGSVDLTVDVGAAAKDATNVAKDLAPVASDALKIGGAALNDVGKGTSGAWHAFTSIF